MIARSSTWYFDQRRRAMARSRTAMADKVAGGLPRAKMGMLGATKRYLGKLHYGCCPIVASLAY
jgi:hypothetical protein